MRKKRSAPTVNSQRARCRNCAELYFAIMSTADWQGYCSKRCVHQAAKVMGYKRDKGSSKLQTVEEYEVLKAAGQIGMVYQEESK